MATLFADYIFELTDALTAELSGVEVLCVNGSGEDSDFVRFNQARVRQAGHVSQQGWSLRLIDGARHASASLGLTGERGTDLSAGREMLLHLRSVLPDLPEDPHLLYNTEPTETMDVNDIPAGDAGEMVDAILSASEGTDMVGILATGGLYRAYATSLGQRNGFVDHNCHFDWSLYHSEDKAVKCSLASQVWDGMLLEQKMAGAHEGLSLLRREPKTLSPGKYRVYFPPEAWYELMYLISAGFSLRARRTKMTPLLRMDTDDAVLSEKVTLCDHPAACVTPRWAQGGFLRPEELTLMEAGKLVNTMASPRTAKEYGVEPTGDEYPSALSMAGGDIPADRVLETLGTGLVVNQLWYVNYSDVPGGRLTGMTRFATFWVEDGKLVAPVNVMRFDETLYHFLGDHLVGVTDTPMLLPESSTYGHRSTQGMRLPGLMVDDFTFTL